ncbi:cysteine hydrolase family protein [Mycolicibacterium vinylchloridicum]|uniref:cysteine hydrolase family protein n=1 Tax=Mycolicibacterium vinylchloridicum TaxID=2736928 RepID=UPI0015C716D3|nr:cysteine hydrolase [Mycolicibacterium vinylchloridicum]
MGTALLLMDIQHGTTSRYGATPEYFDRVVAAQAKAEDANIPVILVRVGFDPGYPEVSDRNKSFTAVKKSGNLVLGEPSTEVEPRLLRGKGELVVTKKRISAFAGSDLPEVLRARDVDHLVLAGIATGGVVLSTIRQAADLDYQLTVLSDLCLDLDEEVHRVLIEKVFPRHGDVVTSATWAP